jgi:hypothetical protein
MSLDPISVVYTGLTVVLVGGVWTLAALLGRGKGGWRTALGLACGFGAASAGLTLADRTTALATLALAGASLGIAFLRSGLPAWLAKLAARPAAHASMLCAAGLALTAYGLFRIDADLKSNMNESAQMMADASAAVELGPSAAPAARTDQSRRIPLWVPSAGSLDDLQTFSEADFVRRLRLETHLIQTGPMDGDYNCHGWVFTGGKFWVRGGHVDTILQDNGYRETKRPTIGDLCVYRNQDGEVAHTAVVRGLGADDLILLESKWGKLGRYIHSATTNHAYTSHKPTFYRTGRGTHLLAGIEEVRPEVFATTGDAE